MTKAVRFIPSIYYCCTVVLLEYICSTSYTAFIQSIPLVPRRTTVVQQWYSSTMSTWYVLVVLFQMGIEDDALNFVTIYFI